jgi:hypothetical protein
MGQQSRKRKRGYCSRQATALATMPIIHSRGVMRGMRTKLIQSPEVAHELAAVAQNNQHFLC